MNWLRIFRSIQSKLVIIYVLLILIAMQLIGVYFVRTLNTYFVNNFTISLNKQANLVAEYVAPYMERNKPVDYVDTSVFDKDISEVISKLFSIHDGEIQVIDTNGVVLRTSVQDHANIVGQKNTRIEVFRALQGIKNNETMLKDVDGFRKKIIATPIITDGKIIGAIYIVASMEDMYQTMSRINQIFISGTIIALGLTAILGIMLSHTITNPIKEITVQATAIANGNFKHHVQVQNQDEIGKLAEAFNYMTDRLKEALTLNEEEKEKLASILASMSDGVIAADEFGQIMLINQKAQWMLDLQEEQIGVKPLFALLNLSREQLADLVQADEPTSMIYHFTNQSAETISIRVSLTPILRHKGKMSGTIALLHDVTDQEKLEQSRKEFVANVSHELRTPLTTIKSYMEALEDGALEDEQLAKRFVGVVRHETDRMIRLVSDLLHLSRLDSQKSTLSYQDIKIAEMFDEVADRFAFQLQQKSIDLVIQIAEDVPKVRLDRDKIDQVLDNLVSNAIKYTLDFGNIILEAKKVRNFIQISIADSGIGIPKKDIVYIFDRFYRVDKARTRNMGGTGLGLSIAREIVKAHGGTIQLESELDKGTTVTFTLPIYGERINGA